MRVFKYVLSSRSRHVCSSFEAKNTEKLCSEKKNNFLLIEWHNGCECDTLVMTKTLGQKPTTNTFATNLSLWQSPHDKYFALMSQFRILR